MSHLYRRNINIEVHRDQLCCWILLLQLTQNAIQQQTKTSFCFLSEFCLNFLASWWANVCFTPYLFSVSSSLRVLCASSSWACRAVTLSCSNSFCCTLSILFSCCNLINFSLKRPQTKTALTQRYKGARRKGGGVQVVPLTCTQLESIQLPGYRGLGFRKEEMLHKI